MPALGILRTAYRLWSARGARFLGAAVAFYALLSAAPLCVVILHGVGALFGRERAESALWSGLATWLAPESLATVRGLTERLDEKAASGSVLGILLVVYGSTRLFRAVKRALNQLWGIDLEAIEERRSSAKKYGIRYGQALLLILLTAILVALLIACKGAITFLAAFSTRAPPAIFFVLDVAASTAIAFALFFALFRVLPERDVTAREAATSALVSTVLFALGSELVTLYVQHKHLADLYEGAATVVLAVVWVYYSAQVFFFGACIGAAMEEVTSRRSKP